MQDKIKQTASPFRISLSIGNFFLCVAALGLCLLVLLNTMNVLGRLLLSSPFTWVDECMTFVMMISVLAGAIGAASKDCHINVGIVRQMLPPTISRAIYVLSGILTIGVLTLMGYASTKIVGVLRMFDQRSDAMDFPVWIIQSAVPVFMFFSAIMIACRIFRRGADETQGKEH